MISNSSQHAISIVPETVYGTTPATPAFKRKGITGTTLAMAKGTVESGTIRPDRQVDDYRHTTRQVGGDINFELNALGFHDILEAVLCSTWADVAGKQTLKAGSTRHSFSVLRHFTDQSGGDKAFHLFKGVEFNTFKLTLKPEDLVKCSVGVIGQDLVLSTAAPTGSTYTEASAARAFDAFTGSILLGGVAMATATELALTIENGMDPRFVVGDDKSIRPKIGKFRVTGSVTVHFENATLLEQFYNAEELTMSFELLDDAGNGYTFSLGRILLNGGQPDVEGDADIMLTVPFQAMVDEDGATLVIEQEEA